MWSPLKAPTWYSLNCPLCVHSKHHLHSPLTFAWAVQLLNIASPPMWGRVFKPDKTTFPDIEAHSECNQGQSLRSTAPLQNTQREQRNQVELFFALSSPANAEAAASRTLAPPSVTQRGIISVEPRLGLRQGGRRGAVDWGRTRWRGFWEGGVLPPSADPAWGLIITDPPRASNQAANQLLLSAITKREAHQRERNKKTQQYLPFSLEETILGGKK